MRETNGGAPQQEGLSDVDQRLNEALKDIDKKRAQARAKAGQTTGDEDEDLQTLVRKKDEAEEETEVNDEYLRQYTESEVYLPPKTEAKAGEESFRPSELYDASQPVQEISWIYDLPKDFQKWAPEDQLKELKKTMLNEYEELGVTPKGEIKNWRKYYLLKKKNAEFAKLAEAIDKLENRVKYKETFEKPTQKAEMETQPEPGLIEPIRETWTELAEAKETLEREGMRFTENTPAVFDINNAEVGLKLEGKVKDYKLSPTGQLAWRRFQALLGQLRVDVVAYPRKIRAAEEADAEAEFYKGGRKHEEEAQKQKAEIEEQGKWAGELEEDYKKEQEERKREEEEGKKVRKEEKAKVKEKAKLEATTFPPEFEDLTLEQKKAIKKHKEAEKKKKEQKAAAKKEAEAARVMKEEKQIAALMAKIQRGKKTGELTDEEARLQAEQVVLKASTAEEEEPEEPGTLTSLGKWARNAAIGLGLLGAAEVIRGGGGTVQEKPQITPPPEAGRVATVKMGPRGVVEPGKAEVDWLGDEEDLAKIYSNRMAETGRQVMRGAQKRVEAPPATRFTQADAERMATSRQPTTVKESRAGRGGVDLSKYLGPEPPTPVRGESFDQIRVRTEMSSKIKFQSELLSTFGIKIPASKDALTVAQIEGIADQLGGRLQSLQAEQKTNGEQSFWKRLFRSGPNHKVQEAGWRLLSEVDEFLQLRRASK